MGYVSLFTVSHLDEPRNHPHCIPKEDPKMKQKKSQQSVDSLLKSIVKDKLEEQIGEQMGGLPSASTQEELNQDEDDRPLDDVDFFEYCHQVFVISKGTPVTFFVKRDGEYLATIKSSTSNPVTWDVLRSKYGPGTYMVQARSGRGTFLKQQTMTLAEVPDDLTAANESDGLSGFPFGSQAPASSTSDIMPLIALMQQQNERADAQRREDRLADEARRREDREKSNDLYKLLIPALAPVVATFLTPKEKDNGSNMMLEFVKESQRNAQEQFKDILLRMERQNEKPKETGPSTMELMKMRDDAYKSGKDDQKEIYELVEEKAEIRAEELAEKLGDGEDSTITTLIKALGPSLATALTARGSATPVVDANQVPGLLPVMAAQTVETQSSTGEPLTPASLPEANERNQIQEIVVPFVIENLQKMAQEIPVDPKAAGKESLQLLKEKGFSQAQVVKSFPREYFFGLIANYGLPKELDPWFNDYYASIMEKPVTAPSRLRQRPKPTVVPSRLKTRAQVNEEQGHGNASIDGSDVRSSPGVNGDPVVLPPDGGSSRTQSRSDSESDHSLSR